MRQISIPQHCCALLSPQRGVPQHKKIQPQANDHHLAMVCHLMTTYIIKCDQEDTNIKGVAAYTHLHSVGYPRVSCKQ